LNTEKLKGSSTRVEFIDVLEGNPGVGGGVDPRNYGGEVRIPGG
jgi:hypothetical protein